ASGRRATGAVTPICPAFLRGRSGVDSSSDPSAQLFGGGAHRRRRGVSRLGFFDVFHPAQFAYRPGRLPWLPSGSIRSWRKFEFIDRGGALELGGVLGPFLAVPPTTLVAAFRVRIPPGRQAGGCGH